MSQKGELYKKFMVQKSVLDTLRVYIDITDDLLDRLNKLGLLDEGEVMIVQKLGWPSSRNQLLQMLVKKPWNKQTFQGFCDVLKDTQKDEKFLESFGKKVTDFMKGHELELAEEDGAPKDPIQNMLDNILLGLPLGDQIKIRTMLKEKDDQIGKLKAQEDELGHKLRAVTEENVILKTQLHNLDKAATDLVSSFQYEAEPATIEEGLHGVRTVLDSRQATINELKAEQEKILEKLHNQKEWTSQLTTEILQLKEHKTVLEKELEELKQKYHEEVFDLSRRLEEEKDLTKKLQSRLQAMEKYYTKELRQRNEKIEHMNIELTLASKRLHDAQEERNTAVAELESYKDKTRKLLVHLGLENECKNLGISLDFARNMTYVNKKTLGKTNSRPKLNPINIDHPQSPPMMRTGRRDSDVTIRPYPELLPSMSESSSNRNKTGLHSVDNTPRKYTVNLPPIEN